MARRIPIVSVSPTGVGPGLFVIGPSSTVVSGDWTSVFQGRFYRLSIAPFTTAPHYPGSPGPTYQLIQATQFEVVDNPSYNGRYTVYTPVSALDYAASTFGSGQTTIRVSEAIGAPTTPGDDGAVGAITNVSTYLIDYVGDSDIVIPPGVTIVRDGIEYPGRGFSGYGEIFNQNYARLLQNFASPTTPVDAAPGQLWWDVTVSVMKVFDGSLWQVVNQSAIIAASASTRVAFSAAANVPVTITHNLGATFPFTVMSQFFVDISGAWKPILPADMTFVDANSFTVTFTAAYTGHALVRL